MTSLSRRALWNTGPPRLRYEEAAVDVASAASTEFAAIEALAGAVQSRCSTPPRLLSALSGRERIPRRAWLKSVLEDVAEGTHSVLEHGYLTRVERAHGLPRARRQRPVSGPTRMVYRDVDYDGLVVELDGRMLHDSAGQRDRDYEPYECGPNCRLRG